jgi:hypothetical protein
VRGSGLPPDGDLGLLFIFEPAVLSRWDLCLSIARGWKVYGAHHVSTRRFGIRLPAPRNRGAPLLAVVARDCWADAGCLPSKIAVNEL